MRSAWRSTRRTISIPSTTRADLTRIYVLRQDARLLQDRPVRVFDGEMEIGTLDNGTYLCWERRGGRTLGRAYFGALDPSRGQLEGIADFDCPEGSVNYFKIVVSREEGRPSIEKLAPEEGRQLVAERRAAGR